mmetsp:Transcript_1084/g.2602  ORF Transcript_1084/g.2602 Transcript_1084/m.2602 type:complete len:215 (-) Transcript_1084:209-853(-)
MSPCCAPSACLRYGHRCTPSLRQAFLMAVDDTPSFLAASDSETSAIDSSTSRVIRTGPCQFFLPCPALHRGKMAVNCSSEPCSASPMCMEPSGISATPASGMSATPACCRCAHMPSPSARRSVIAGTLSIPPTCIPAPNLVTASSASLPHVGAGPGVTGICLCSGTGIIIGYCCPIRWCSGGCIKAPGRAGAVCRKSSEACTACCCCSRCRCRC